MPTYCIMCGKEKSGLAVADDRVLDALRWFKRNVTKNEQRNGLVVCKECHAAYTKARSRYTSRRTIYLVVGGVFFILIFLVSFSIGALIYGLGVLAFMYLLSLLNYTPGLQIYAEKRKAAKQKHNQ